MNCNKMKIGTLLKMTYDDTLWESGSTENIDIVARLKKDTFVFFDGFVEGSFIKVISPSGIGFIQELALKEA